MVRSSRLFYLICYMLKKIDFQKNFECAEPFCRNINFTENKWRPAPASSRSWLSSRDIVAAIKFCLIVHCKVQQNVKLNKRYNNGITYSQSATQRHINIYSINTDSDSRIWNSYVFSSHVSLGSSRHYLLKVLQYPLSSLSNFLLELCMPESRIRNKACDTIDLLS